MFYTGTRTNPFTANVNIKISCYSSATYFLDPLYNNANWELSSPLMISGKLQIRTFSTGWQAGDAFRTIYPSFSFWQEH